MYGHTPAGDEVWGLHLAFLDAAKVGDIIYAPDEKTVAEIEELATHHEAELALVDILSFAAPPLVPELHDQAVRAARRIWSSDPEPSVREQVQAWLNWYPGSSSPPPYMT